MNILITGATGFIGSHLADLLKSENHNIYLSIRKTSNLRWIENKGFNLIFTNFEDNSENMVLFSNIDYIYHLAGVTSAKDYNGYLTGNRDLTKKVIDLAYKYSKNLKKFVFISSQTASGPAISADLPSKEDDICLPITSYGKSKREAEEVVISYFNKIPCCIVRPPAVYGPRDTEIFAVFKTVKYGLGTLIGFNKKLVSLVNVIDLVNGIKLAGESDNSNNQIYFISSDEFFTWDYLLDLMKNAFGNSFLLKLRLPHFLVLTIAAISGIFGKYSAKPPVFNYEKGIDFIQNYWICSIEKAKKELNYNPKIDADKGIKLTIDWYKENKWL